MGNYHILVYELGLNLIDGDLRAEKQPSIARVADFVHAAERMSVRASSISSSLLVGLSDWIFAFVWPSWSGYSVGRGGK
jgi:hypothetical protein